MASWESENMVLHKWKQFHLRKFEKSQRELMHRTYDEKSMVKFCPFYSFCIIVKSEMIQTNEIQF